MPRIVWWMPGPRYVNSISTKWSPGRQPISQNSRVRMLGPEVTDGTSVGSPVVPEVENTAVNGPPARSGSTHSRPP